ncbi:MAG: hypothetical protein U0359_33445 [Byssovorax sp.]
MDDDEEPRPKQKPPSYTTEDLEAAATHEGGGRKDGLGVLFAAAGLGLLVLLLAVAGIAVLVMRR